MSKLINTTEAAQILGVRSRTVRRYVELGHLRATKFPGKTGAYVFTREDLDAFVNGPCEAGYPERCQIHNHLATAS